MNKESMNRIIMNSLKDDLWIVVYQVKNVNGNDGIDATITSTTDLLDWKLVNEEIIFKCSNEETINKIKKFLINADLSDDTEISVLVVSRIRETHGFKIEQTNTIKFSEMVKNKDITFKLEF